MCHGLPFRDPACEFWVIAFVPDKCPAFFIPNDIVICSGGAVLDKGLGVLQVSVDGLDCCCYAVFLVWV